MVRQVLMPRLGESITEGTVIRWFKNPGEHVQRDEALFEVSTDKVDTEIPSPFEGTLDSILVAEGTTVEVGTPLCLVRDGVDSSDGDASAGDTTIVETKAPQVSRSAPSTASPSPRPMGERQDSGRPHALSPAVRKLVAEHDLVLDSMDGSGDGGRLTKRDVEAQLQANASASSHSVAAEDTGLEPLSAMRQQIANHMVRSKRTSPHVSTVHEVDMTATRKLRDELRTSGTKLTYLPFVAQAVARSLMDHPWLNASLVGDSSVRFHPTVHLGFAVAMADGLIVPVLNDCQDLSLTELSSGIHHLASRSRKKTLTPDEVQGGTFTITNAGVSGMLIGTPIIAQPQAAILCFGAVKKRVVVLDEESEETGVRSMAFLSLTFDHRIVDGATSDAFMAAVKQMLENAEFEI